MLDVIRVTTTGSAGSATGSQKSELPFSGFIQGIAITTDALAPDTTDVTITENGGLGRTILAVTNLTHGTTTIYNPQFEIQNNAGVAQDLYSSFYISSQSLLVTVGGSDAVTNAVIVKTVVSQEDRR